VFVVVIFRHRDSNETVLLDGCNFAGRLFNVHISNRQPLELIGKFLTYQESSAFGSNW
jgi:hypothetical protein